MPVDASGPRAFEEVMGELGAKCPENAWREGWEVSQRSYAPEGPFFLSRDFVAEACHWMGMSTDVRAVYLDALSLFDASPALKRVLWHCHHFLFRADQSLTKKRSVAAAWPLVPPALHPAAPLFYGFVFLSGTPFIRAFHQSRTVPLRVTLDTLSDLEIWTRRHLTRHGVWGMTEKNWLVSHYVGDLYTLGRLQYRFDDFTGCVAALRHRRTRRLVLLAADGLRFRTDGQLDGTDGVFDSDHPWTSRLERRAGSLCGNPISVLGAARRDPIDLPEQDWEEVLSVGMPVLTIHIPGTGQRMDYDACGESLRQARDFFPRHVPDRPFKAFVCQSWLCDNQFSELLSPASNIRRFQEEMYLFPAGGGRKSILLHVFDNKFRNIEDIPQTNSLFRTLVQHARSGGQWRNGGALLLPEDLDWGGQVYRRRLARPVDNEEPADEHR